MPDRSPVFLDLTGPERKQLHTALVRAFDREGLAELTSFALDERLDANDDVPVERGRDRVRR